jgi:K+-transporting ATPase KdpF subunit
MFDLAAIDRYRVLHRHLSAPLRARAGLMSAADIFGLAISIAVLAYLVYALFRGERF